MNQNRLARNKLAVGVFTAGIMHRGIFSVLLGILALTLLPATSQGQLANGYTYQADISVLGDLVHTPLRRPTATEF